MAEQPKPTSGEAGQKSESVSDIAPNLPERNEAPSGILTKPPALSKAVEAIYPNELFAQGITGDVLLLITIDEAGGVVEAIVETSSGHPALDEAASDAVLAFEFQPAEVDGQPAPVQILYKYSFTIQEVETAVPLDTTAVNSANGSLSGTLVERGTRKILPGFLVRLPELDREAVTDAKGYFHFEGIPAGGVMVEVDDEDYIRLLDEETIVQDQETEVTYYLERSSVTDDTIYVVSRRPKKEVARRTITVQEIRKIPGTQGDALKVVQNLPGAARIPFGGGGLIIRGSNPGDSGSVIGRHWVPLVYHFGGIRSIFPSELIESIDFYPGNFGAEFGRFGGGIVDVRVKRPRSDRLHGRFEADVFDAGILLEGPVTENATFAIAGRRSYIDAVLPAVIPEDAGVDLTIAPRYYDYQAIYDWKKGDHRIRGSIFGSHDALKFLLEDSINNDPALAGNFENETSFYRGFAQWQWRISDKIFHDLSLSAGRNQFRLNIGPSVRFDNRVWLLAARDDWRFDVSKNLRIRIGTDTEIVTGEIDIKAPQPPKEGGDRGQNLSTRESLELKRPIDLVNPAVWLEIEGKLLEERLLLVPGLRLDYDQYLDETLLDPRLTVRYNLTARSALKAGIGLFSQRPSPDESDPTFGNPAIEYEKAVHYSGGVEYAVTNALSIDLVGFYKDLYNLVVSTDPDDAAEAFSADGKRTVTNDGEGRTYGLEALVRHDVGEGFFGWVSYTLMRAERLDPGTTDYRVFDFDQTHILTLVGQYRLSTKWEFGARFRYVTGNPYTPFQGSIYSSDTDTYEPFLGDTNSTRNPPFHQLDIRIDRNWIFEQWILSAYLEVRNLYNRQNIEGLQYNYDYSSKEAVNGLPVIPSIGIRGEF